MCSSLKSYLPCCRLTFTNLGLSPISGPSAACFSQGKMSSWFWLTPCQPSPTALCHRAFPDSVYLATTMLFTSSFFPKSPGLSPAVHSTSFHVLKVLLNRKTCCFLWIGTQSQEQGSVQKRRSYVLPKGPSLD